MALTNLDKETTTRLFQMLSLKDNESKNLEIIKKNYSSFGQLKILAEQISNLQNKAQEIIHEAQINDYLHNIEMQTKKVPGQVYYHYKFKEKDVLSIIAPEEWNTYDSFHGAYLYNYDSIFYKQH
tara:strand:+ start:256 stop:630 length:375 start_codon:yes stop_codon:yes gene_type:complete